MFMCASHLHMHQQSHSQAHPIFSGNLVLGSFLAQREEKFLGMRLLIRLLVWQQGCIESSLVLYMLPVYMYNVLDRQNLYSVV